MNKNRKYTECYVFERRGKFIIWTNGLEEIFDRLKQVVIECQKKYNRDRSIIFITEVPKGVQGKNFAPSRKNFFQILLKDPCLSL